jgi:hypothetical protein
MNPFTIDLPSDLAEEVRRRVHGPWWTAQDIICAALGRYFDADLGWGRGDDDDDDGGPDHPVPPVPPGAAVDIIREAELVLAER